MANLTLYYAIPSRGMTVHWMLEELGQPYDVEVLDLQDDEHKRPEYLAINPMGKVPALRHGEHVITETAAICAYLADAFPDAGLSVPIDSPLRGDYLRWLFFGPATAEPAILWKMLGEAVSGLDYQPFADVEAVAAELQRVLSGREFVVGDHFTAADVVIGSTLMWGLNMVRALPQLPALAQYWAALERRPAWRRAHADDQARASGVLG